jgi:putative endonuclease
MDPVAFIVARFSRLLNSPFRWTERDPEMAEHAWIGQRGEDIAAAWLRGRGAKILYRNFRAPGGGEVDIVAREGKVLLFTEVKTRMAGGEGRPLDAVDDKKRSLMRRGGKEWLKLLGRRDLPWRYDVIEVVLTPGEKPAVNRVENVTRRRIRQMGGMPPQDLSAAP